MRLSYCYGNNRLEDIVSTVVGKINLWLRSSQEEGDYPFIEPVNGRNAVWTNRHTASEIDATKFILSHFKHVVLKNYDQILNKQLVYEMVQIVEKGSRMTVQNVIPEKISYNLLKEILLELLMKRGRAVNNLIMIIEKIDEKIDKTNDTQEIIEYIIKSGI